MNESTLNPAAANQATGTEVSPERLAEQLDQARAALLEQRSAMMKKRDALQAEIEQIRGLPISEKELGDLACQNVDAHAAAYRRSAPVTAGLDSFRRPGGQVASLRLLDAQKVGEDGALAKIALGVIGGTVQPTLQWFCFYFGDALKSRLRDAFADEQPRGVTTIQQRRKLIDALVERVQEVEAEIRQSEEVLVRLGHRFYGELSA